MSSAERIAWSAWGLLSFIALIAWLHWEGTPQDQKKDEPPQVPKERERQAENGRFNPHDYLTLKVSGGAVHHPEGNKVARDLAA